ncbi:MAG: phosphoenolpyruvate--protein phosphotransferase, partial [Nitrosopumilaceae archaeon]|nr:phosphoenolpyruvate--protein phosphotransferase [Nitrosopumilaceae archaeon]NIU88653.1 phosphoenolpyruvate--protein phosphotransferase [Nitrosopumilaceae archaeon]NIV66800.1 phosphoenolpyruvate--protein phosphotransferase [Nitrosopumilaceae archaeon]NIX62782.1 phosphoenolpyruvate--protein phosphotransferase [Nitrosopumilaceae archaeon]
AIVARSLAVPAVVGVDKITKIVRKGKRIILDGTHGNVIINPKDQTIQKYESERKIYMNFEKELLEESNAVANTRDGKRI